MREDILQVVRDYVRFLKTTTEARLQMVGDAIAGWMVQNLRGPLPDNWRETFRAVLAEQAAQGRIVVPESASALETAISQYAALCAWQGRYPQPPNPYGSQTGHPPTPAERTGSHFEPAVRNRSLDMHAMLTANMKAETQATLKSFRPTETHASRDSGESMVVAERPLPWGAPAPVTAAAEKPLPADWPRLTPKERERVQQTTGLPEWFPFQPTNRMDRVWEMRFEDLARDARQRLVAFFQELALLGRMVVAMGQAKDADLDPLQEQRDKIQQKYDAYLQSRVALQREWTRYMKTETLIGIDVMALMEKIDAALPARVQTMTSPLDAKLEKAIKESVQASIAAQKRVEGIYTALVWTDRVITAIELAMFVGTLKAGATQVFKQAIRKGATEAAAKRAAVTYVAVEVAVASGSTAISAVVVPKVLSYAGLDETQVQIGLAAFAAIGVFSGLAARPIARGTGHVHARRHMRASVRPKQRMKQRNLSPDQARRLSGDAFNKARQHAYPYNEVPIAKPGSGKPWILDSYDPIKGEIVFRRNTQFSEIQFKTAKAYLREFVKKYPPGSTIANVPSARGLGGAKLEGKMIFEVPPQWKSIPQPVLQEADRLDIVIRDSEGKIYHAD